MKQPAKNPCGSCPYRRDVPAGVWSPDEYNKLPPYDRETAEQPLGVFLCHQQDGRVCAGWAATHDMSESIGLRLAVAVGSIKRSDAEAVLDYKTDVPLWPSGTIACIHGMSGVEEPSEEAKKTMAKLERKRARKQ